MATKRLIPTGVCWCGCGQDAGLGKFFLPGHDKIAESKVIAEKYGSVADFVAAHDSHPDGKTPLKATKRSRK